MKATGRPGTRVELVRGKVLPVAIKQEAGWAPEPVKLSQRHFVERKVAVWLEARRQCVGRMWYLHKLCIVVSSSSFCMLIVLENVRFQKKMIVILVTSVSCIRYICVPFLRLT
jgi:hypothetical protein